jgi:hypothetical protein
MPYTFIYWLTLIHADLFLPYLTKLSAALGYIWCNNRSACGVLVGKPEGKRPFGNLSLDVMVILKWIFKK